MFVYLDGTVLELRTVGERERVIAESVSRVVSERMDALCDPPPVRKPRKQGYRSRLLGRLKRVIYLYNFFISNSGYLCNV